MKKWSVVMVLALAQFVMVLDGTVMNVSISTIVEDLDTTVSSLQTAITFYTLTMAALMLIGAKLCAKWGLLKAFMIGSVVYGIGSLVTGFSVNMGMLFLGWSVIEGLGAVLVIPAIAALVATNYSGKDRITAYAIIGGISGAAAAAGPLIGGFMTTYLSWRYVFIAETIIMLFVIFFARKFQSSKPDKTQKIDIPSAFLSASGMALLVYALLQTKTWGLITPLAKPEIAGKEIAPLGISIVAYLLLASVFLLKSFYDRQVNLESDKKSEQLLTVSMLKISQLRSGLTVMMSQTMITASVFFVVPVYLQLSLGLNAIETGKKILPLSIALIFASVVGSKIASKYSAKKIVRIGQILLIAGPVLLVSSINPELSGFSFTLSMLFLGTGLGLLASQLGNINVSAVDDEKTNEVGGLQGVFQNLGSSLGTAIIGSILIASLTTGFVSNVNNSDLPNNIKTYINDNSNTGIQVVAPSDVNQYALEVGVSQKDAETLAGLYSDAQISGLKESVSVIAIIGFLSLMLSKNIPNRIMTKSAKK